MKNTGLFGFVIDNNKPTTVVKEKNISFNPGDTINDIKSQLITNNEKFQIRVIEEYYRKQTKKLPRRIDISYTTATFDNYQDFMSNNNFQKWSNAGIKKIELDEADSMDGSTFMDMFSNNRAEYIVSITLKMIKLSDNTTPRQYSLQVEDEDEEL